MANRFFYTYTSGPNANDSCIPKEALISYYDSLIFDQNHRTIWHNGMPYGNVYPGTESYGEVFNSIDFNAAYGAYTHVEGYYTVAYKGTLASHVEGYYSYVKEGKYGHAEGVYTSIINSDGAHVEGFKSYIYNGKYGHAEGYKSYVQAIAGHAEGTSTVTANHAHAENASLAQGTYSHTEGISTSIGTYSHAEGYSKSESDADYSHAENASLSIGSYSHAEGISTSEGSYSHAENASKAIGTYSHSEGLSTLAGGDYSHSEGAYTTTLGLGSHSEGAYIYSTGNYSHTQGAYNSSYGNIIHVEGVYNTAGSNNINALPGGHVEGLYNKIEKNGHIEGAYNSSNGQLVHIEGTYNKVENDYGHAEGYHSYVQGKTAHAEGSWTYAIGDDSHVQGSYNSAKGMCSFVTGSYSTSYGLYASSIGEGLLSYNEAEVSVGKWNISEEKNETRIFEVGIGTSEENRSNAFSVYTDGTTYFANQLYLWDGNSYINIYNSPESILEQTVGRWNKDGNLIYAEYFNDYEYKGARANYSHAEGYHTIAGADYSHAEGLYTQTTNEAEFAAGKYNASKSNSTLFSVGNGTSEDNRSNAFSVHTDGTSYLFDNTIVCNYPGFGNTYIWKGNLEKYKQFYQDPDSKYKSDTIYFIDDGNNVQGTSLPTADQINKINERLDVLQNALNNCVFKFNDSSSTYIWTGTLNEFEELKSTYNGTLPSNTTFIVNP